MKTFRSIYLLLTGFQLTAFAICQPLPGEPVLFEIDTLGQQSEALAINDYGEIVGSDNSNNGTSAFIYSNGSTTTLASFGGDTSVASGINNAGQVVGYANEPGNVITNAFIYSNGTMTNLGTLGGVSSQASGINDSGVITGAADYIPHANGAPHAFSYSNGVMTDLGAPPGSVSFGFAINNSGQIAGVSQNGAVLYSHGVFTKVVTVGGFSAAYAINNLGEVAGTFQTNAGVGGHTDAFLYSNGVMTDLGFIGQIIGGLPGGSSAQGINDAGQIVGYSSTNTSYGAAFIYSKSTGMKDLNVLYASLLVSGKDSKAGFTFLDSAFDINNSGQIVGTGEYWNGISSTSRGFLLDMVPEPSIGILLIGALSGLTIIKRIRVRN